MKKLAINGGDRIRKTAFPNYKVIGEEEAKVAYDVVSKGILSDYLGCWDDAFLGGEQVRSFEKEWAEKFKVKHAITVNSNSSGILCALGAAGVGPGDEVIVSPYSMSISASAPIFYGALPVFADIDDDYFCIDPEKVERLLTEKTKAIIAVDIFGHSYNYKKINAIAKKRGITVIEDCAQAPAGMIDGKMTGTNGDMGIYSLNYHKHIHTGEGGVIVTNDDDLALRCQLIRNHAETVVDDIPYKGSPVNMVGLNLRMTEVEAAIGRQQLKKLDGLVEKRLSNIKYLEKHIKDIPFLTMPKIEVNCKHAFYVHAMKYNIEKADNISREKYVEAVNQELMFNGKNDTRNSFISCGYVKPLYLQSLYQNKTGIGSVGYPFNDPLNKNRIQNYEKGICPVVERMHYKELFSHDLIHASLTMEDMQDIADAFIKVSENLGELR